MRISEIQKLAEIMERYSLTAVRLGEGEERVELERAPAVVTAAAQPAVTAAPSMPIVGESTVSVETHTPSAASSSDVRSPMVGVFYSAPSPDAEPFVKIGDRVHKGDVLCIIEAMKLMNEITAESDGEVVDICVENGQLVEFDQCLMRIE